MNPLQESKHWRLWSAACKTQGWKTSDNTQRYAQYAIALGRSADFQSAVPQAFSLPAHHPSHNSHISLKSLVKQSDIDKVFDHFTQLASNNTDLKAAVRQANPDEGERQRLIWAITHRHAEALYRHVAFDKFGTSELTDLTNPQLIQLRNTLDARASARKKKKLEPYDRAEAKRELAHAATASADPF